VAEDQDDSLNEECGVLGLYTPNLDAARVAFFGLFALQHRGQESAGIAVSDGSRVRMHKDLGLVAHVFDDEKALLRRLPGHFAVAHTRYSTTGRSVQRNAGPICCKSQVGDVAVAHNGNLINAAELRAKMMAEGEVFETTSDSEVLARILVRHMHEGPEKAVAEVMSQVKGAYSITALTPTMVIGFRDPNGIRPLVTGHLSDGGYMIASETCAIRTVGGTPGNEVRPGEMVVIDKSGFRTSKVAAKTQENMCLFEFLYFARPDSHLYDRLIYSVRERMGEELAKEHPVCADVVVPVPDSGIPAALGYSRISGIPYREGMMKSRYIHRTFIQPDQKMRELGVRMKLLPLVEHIQGKRIVLVDDSIVRGTTTKNIVSLLYDAGASEVHVRITAPPIKHPCFYGIDMASKGELASAVMSCQELEAKIGASSLGFLSIDGAVRATGRTQSSFCLACFNGKYPIPVPKELKKNAFEAPPDVGEFSTVVAGQLSLLEVNSA
jgi:amidophosphoribosyltransferase